MKIGDKVSVIDDNLSGIITSVHGNRVMFRDEHGFTHNYLMENLVLHNDSIYKDMEVEFKPVHRKNVSKKHGKNNFVLDLHFEKLVDKPSKYDSFERLLIQKEKLLETLDYCRNNHLKRLEIVHGIGDGTLQKMVHDTLESQTGLDFHNKDILHHQSGTVIVFLH